MDSAFPTLRDEMDHVISPAILRPLIRFFAEREPGLQVDRLRPVEQIGRIHPRPVFIIQGLADTVIPPDSAQRLYAAAGEARLLWVEPGVGHLGMYQALPAAYERRVIGFLNAVFGER